MKDKELAEAIENINVDIEKGNGKKVRIFCEWTAGVSCSRPEWT
jgi:hypothetical protein